MIIWCQLTLVIERIYWPGASTRAHCLELSWVYQQECLSFSSHVLYTEWGLLIVWQLVSKMKCFNSSAKTESADPRLSLKVTQCHFCFILLINAVRGLAQVQREYHQLHFLIEKNDKTFTDIIHPPFVYSGELYCWYILTKRKKKRSFEITI